MKKNGSIRADIAIVGFGDLGKKLLHYGLILNCYDTAQSIHYHVWGNTKLFEADLPNLNSLINDIDISDRVDYENTDFRKDVQSLYEMDRIILTDECDAEFVQTVIRGCPEKEVFFVNTEGGSLERYYRDNIKTYAACNTYDVNEILREAEYEAAKEVNARYSILFGDRTPYEKGSKENYNDWKDRIWNALSPFLKESNIIVADYHVLREKILHSHSINKESCSREVHELLVMEHLRWCRFHYLNGWKHAEEKVIGDRKNETLRLHSLLKGFNDLLPEDETKDLEIIASMLLRKVMRENYFEPTNGNVIEDDIRYQLISEMALMKYGERARKYCELHIDRNDLPETIAFTGFGLEGLAHMLTIKELFDISGMRFFITGFDDEILELTKAHSGCNVEITKGASSCTSQTPLIQAM